MAKVFSQKTVNLLGRNYHSKVRKTPRGGCMRAVYIGLGSLYDKEFGFKGPFHKAFFRRSRRREIRRGLPEGRLNTIDRVFRALEEEGIAMDEQVFKPFRTEWKKADGSIIPSLEDELVDQVFGLPNGSHFFGAAISGACAVRNDRAPTCWPAVARRGVPWAFDGRTVYSLHLYPLQNPT